MAGPHRPFPELGELILFDRPVSDVGWFAPDELDIHPTQWRQFHDWLDRTGASPAAFRAGLGGQEPDRAGQERRLARAGSARLG